MLVYGGEKDVENFDRGVRHGFSLRGKPQPTLTEEILRPSCQFTKYRGYNCARYDWAPTLTVRQVRTHKDPEHMVWPLVIGDPDWLIADHMGLPA